MTEVTDAERLTSVEPGLDAEPSPRGGSPAERLGVIALVALAPIATIYLAFNNGGYFPDAVGLTAIVFAAALVLRTTLAEHPFLGYNRRLTLAIVALALFDLLQLASALWSHTDARALDGFDRTLLYLLAFALFGSLPRNRQRLLWITRALAAAMAAVCLAALISRVLPHLWPTAAGFYSQRLSYPLGYWNAVGFMAAVATILLLHLASSLQEPRPIRVAAATLLPATAATLLLTYSRGALGVAALGLVVYAVLGRPRALVSALIAVVPPAAFALHKVYGAELLSSARPTSPAAIAQGRHVAATVAVCMLIAGCVRALALLLDHWLEHAHILPSALRRLPRWVAPAGAAAAIVIVLISVGAAGFISREYDRFIHVHAVANTPQVRDRLTDPASNGRVMLWHVALRQYRQDELRGAGAGTYQTYFAQHRTANDYVTDAHSLYLQTLGEDGLVGLALLSTALLSVLVILATRLRSPRRSVYAALLAAALAWAIHNAVDWDWQMPAITLWLFIIGGHALAAPQPRSRPSGAGPRNRTALALGWLVLAVGPLLIGFSYHRLRASGQALASGDCGAAKQRALSSISLLAVRPDAYEVIGYCDLQQAFPADGLTAMRKAVSYDKQDWDYHYGLAIALAANGLDPRSEARRAVNLNPRSPLTQFEAQAFTGSHPQRWEQVARVVLLQGLQSRGLSVSNL